MQKVKEGVRKGKSRIEREREKKRVNEKER